MDFKQCTIDWQDILHDGAHGIYYVTKEWRRLVTDDTSENIQGMHKRTVSPTYARKRIIILEGYIDGLWNDNQQSAQTYLESIFSLQTDPSSLIPKELYIKDIYDHEWILDVKVKTPVEFVEASDEFTGYAIKWRVELESIEDPTYRSAEEFEIIGTDGVFGGVAFPMSMEFSMISYSNILELSINGSQASPIRWEISVINDTTWPLSITNISTGEYAKFAINATAWDSIIIDANTLTATLNGANILASRIIWSHRLLVQWTQFFSVSDANGALPTEDLVVKAYFRESLL